MKLQHEISAVEHRLEWRFNESDTPTLAVDVKRLPSGQTVSRQSADFWTGVWAVEDGRYFVVTDQEVLWFENQEAMLITMSSVLRSS